MKSIGVVCILTFLIAAIGGDKGKPRILNGLESDIIPYQVLLSSGCGGTLIRPDWVLTAKHCLGKAGDCWSCEDFKPVPPTVWAGISDKMKRERGQERYVPEDSIILHDSNGLDLALLRIDPPFEESDSVKPIQINDIKSNLEGQEVLMSGWGATTSDYHPDQLSEVLVEIKRQQYSSYYPYWVIIMESSKGEGACYGDSGGPAVLKGKNDMLVGVASYVDVFDSDRNRLILPRGFHCGYNADNGKGYWPYHQSVYVDVYRYADWIKEKTENTPENGACEDRIATNKCEKRKAKGKCDIKRNQKKCQRTCGLCD